MSAPIQITLTVNLPVVVRVFAQKDDETGEVSLISVYSVKAGAPDVREIEEALDGANDLQQIDDAYDEESKGQT